MIIFISDPSLIPVISQISGKNQVVYNLTSLYSGYPSLSALATNMYTVNNSGMPTNVFIDSVNFDIMYANSIMSNPQMYEAFMNIMVLAYQGINVIILVQRDNYRDAIMESLIKLIQQRYGYIAWVVEDPDDIECIRESSFSPYGIIALDQDIAKLDDMYNRGLVSSRALQPISME